MSTIVYRDHLEGLEKQYVEKYVRDQEKSSKSIYLSDYEERVLDGIDYAFANAICKNCVYYFRRQCENPNNIAFHNITLPKNFGCNRFRLKNTKGESDGN